MSPDPSSTRSLATPCRPYGTSPCSPASAAPSSWGLTWPDIDLDAGTLEIRTTTTSVRGTAVATDGKTDAAQRRLHLGPELSGILRRHRLHEHTTRLAAGIRPPLHVFTEPTGSPIHPERLSSRFRRLTDDLGLPRIGLHGLRHTAATIMLNNAVPVHIVANRLGHTDASTTLSIYVHVMPNDDRIAAEAMSRVFFNGHDAA